jgi:hypothetical protein
VQTLLPARLDRRAGNISLSAVTGGLAVMIIAVLLFTRFGIHGALSRDEAIYAYGGQQLVRGVPPYTSIFDPKAPLATLLAGLGAGLGKLFGDPELIGIRVVFFVLAVLAVLAIYLLALQLWRSIAGAVVAAVVFASFYRFAADALGGPDAKTAAMFPIVMCMYFAVRRQWFRAGLFGGIGVVAWQPLISFVLVAVVLALTLGDSVDTGAAPVRTDDDEPVRAADIDAADQADAPDTADSAGTADSDDAADSGDIEDAAESAVAAGPATPAESESVATKPPSVATRAPHWAACGRAVLGAVIPIAVIAAYFIAAGAWGDLVEAAVEFPATGVQPPNRTFGEQVSAIVSVVHGQYRFSTTLFWSGTAVLVVFVVAAFVRNRGTPLDALRDPVVSVVGLSWLLQVGYMLYDFEGGPDVFPVLPAPALCIGGLFAMVVNEFRGNGRRLAVGVTLIAALSLAIGSWVRFAARPGHALDPTWELVNACGLEKTVAGTGPLWVMGDPVPLVLTRRTNPDRFIYLGEGVDEWKVSHTVGGFDGWMAQIAAVHPSVVLINNWGGTLQVETASWLKEHGYRRYFIGTWKVFLVPGVPTTALQHGVQVTRRPTEFAIDANGTALSTHCGLPRVG